MHPVWTGTRSIRSSRGCRSYVKLVTQICGENMIVANATGCSSIYGGTFPTIPYCKRDDGRGPAWGNSLFEDNAEYGFGMRLAVESNRTLLNVKVKRILELGTTPELTAALNKSMELWDSVEEEAIVAQREVAQVIEPALIAAEGEEKEVLSKINELKDYFTDKKVWIFGGDGWAYDIGYSGVDHVVASGKNVNILVLDTEVYSNTGGQASKATPIGAVAKFANAGKQLGKKNMGFMCMSYGHVYVASVSMGANRNHTQKALMEAVAYDGPRSSSVMLLYQPWYRYAVLTGRRETSCGCRLLASVPIQLHWKRGRDSAGMQKSRQQISRNSSRVRDDTLHSTRRILIMLKSCSREPKTMPRREWHSIRTLERSCSSAALV